MFASYLVSSEITYEQKNELRHECMQFLRFAYLADFQSINILTRIYNESVNELISGLRQILADFKEQQVNPAPKTKKKEPLFFLSIKPNFGPIDEQHFTYEHIEDYVPPPLGESTFEQFNILYHIHLNPETPEHSNSNSQPSSPKLSPTKKPPVLIKKTVFIIFIYYIYAIRSQILISVFCIANLCVH